MEILSVFDPSFRVYGQVLEGYECRELLSAMRAIPMPEHGTAYEPGIERLEESAVFTYLINE